MSLLEDALKDAFPIVEKFAPSLLSTFGGIPGVAIANILPLLCKSFGTDPAKPNDLVAAILNNTNAPDVLTNLEGACNLVAQHLPQNLSRLTKAELHINLEFSDSKV